MRPCCVPGCNNKTAKRYAIPTEKRIRDIWIDRIGNQKLIGDVNPRFISNYRVCDTHFVGMCRERPGKLKKFALPTLNVPEYYNEKSTEENCFSFPSAQEYATTHEARGFQVVKYSPATSVESPELKMLIPQKVYQPPSKKIKRCEDYPDRNCLSETLDVTILPETRSPIKEKIPKRTDCLTETLDVTVLPETPSPTEEKIPKLFTIMRRCCVPGCNNKTAKRYAIPTEKRIRGIWIDRIGNQKLVAEDNPKLVSNYRVCDTHFSEMCRERPGKLKKFALPTLNLPEYYNEESTEETCFSFPSAQEYTIPRKIKNEPQGFQVIKLLPESPELKTLIPQKVYQPPSKKIKLFEDYSNSQS